MQRTDEWIVNYNKDYFDKQFNEPYRSTIAFADWLEKMGMVNANSQAKILDVGTGKGANIYYMQSRFKNSMFTGIDLNPEFVSEGNQILQAKGAGDRCKLEVGDIYKLDLKFKKNIDGIISLQTLSWLPDFVEPIRSMAQLDASWIALTSLFFDGDVNCKIDLEEYNRGIDEAPKRTFYNVYSLRLIERLFAELGYSKFSYVPFYIDVDLPKPSHKIMGTYTEKLANGTRLQISGPLLMNWYFILAQKK